MTDVLINTATDAGKLTDCAENSTGVLIAAIYDEYWTDCTDILISDDAADELIASDADNSTDYANTNVSDYAVDGFMIFMGLSLFCD